MIKEAGMSGAGRIVVHVGLAKCASTFIQTRYLKAGDLKLVNYMGYEDFTPITEACMQKASGKKISVTPPMLNSGTTQIPASADLPLFATNEILTGLYPLPYRSVAMPVMTAGIMRQYQQLVADQLKQLFASSKNREIHILLVIREPKAWLTSIYRNFIVMGLSEQAESYLAGRTESLAQWYNVDYLYELYCERFGTQRVHVLPFEDLRHRPEDFVNRIDTISGLTPGALPFKNEQMNQSLPDGTLELLRQFYEIIDTATPPEPSWTHVGAQMKYHLWSYLFPFAMNRPEVVEKLKLKEPKLDLSIVIPDKTLVALRANIDKVMQLPHLQTYRESYGLKA